MKIIDTYDDIIYCLSNKKFSMDIWESYADSVSRSFKEKIMHDADDYDFSKDILPIMDYLISNTDKLALAHDSFVNLTSGLVDKIKDTLGTSPDITIIFYLGLCNGAGWATSFEGKPAILLGAEKIVELSWYDEKNMAALIYHEIGHIWHFHVRKNNTHAASEKEKSLWHLYSEGMAMYIEQLLCNDPDFYHQDMNGWLEWCSSNRKRLFAEFLRKIKCSESTQPFFGDWNSFEGKSDIGYYLGGELIKYLSNDYSLSELAYLGMDTIESALEKISL